MNTRAMGKSIGVCGAPSTSAFSRPLGRQHDGIETLGSQAVRAGVQRVEPPDPISGPGAHGFFASRASRSTSGLFMSGTDSPMPRASLLPKNRQGNLTTVDRGTSGRNQSLAGPVRLWGTFDRFFQACRNGRAPRHSPVASRVFGSTAMS